MFIKSFPAPALRAGYNNHPSLEFCAFLALSKLVNLIEGAIRDKCDEIENGKQPILGLHSNFELDCSVHMHVQTSSHRRSDLRKK